MGQQLGGNGQQIAACQRRDLAYVAEARAHHLGGNAKALVMVVDLRDRLHARVVGASTGGLIPARARLLLVPVVNAAHKGRDQLHLGLAASHCLGKREQQREVGVDALALQLCSGLNAFPGGGDLDEHTVDVDAFGLVQLNDALSARDGGAGVKAQAGIHFGGNATRHMLEDFAAKTHQQAVNHLVHRAPLPLGHGVLEQRCVLRLLHRLEDQRRVGGGVLRTELGQLQKVASVGNHGSELFEGVELVHGNGLKSGQRTGQGIANDRGHRRASADSKCRRAPLPVAPAA